jgi:hypothetical protein
MSAKVETFKKYKKPSEIFIETGSYLGDGIQRALDARYRQIHSIELSPELFLQCVNRFNDPNVHLYQGNSISVLPMILDGLQTYATFWLDAHYSGGITAQGNENSPILSELEIIKNHRIKEHTILIDDLRGWYHSTHGFDTLDLMRKILEINPMYEFTLEDGYDFDLKEVYKNDILVAYINKIK